MDNRNEHINPWVEKLKDLQVPGIPESWQAIGALLDAEMPVSPKKDRRRRVSLMLLLLLLVVGICHSPHDRQSSVQNLPRKDSLLAKPRLKASPSNQRIQTPATENKTERNISRATDAEPGNDLVERSVEKRNPVMESGKTNATENNKGISAVEKTNQKKAGDKERLNKVSQFHKELKQNKPGVEKTKSSQLTELAEHATGQKPTRDTITAKEKTAAPSARNQIKKDSIQDAKGWVFALGLNQFFAVGDQQKSNFNADGNSGSISDYIPVPELRYYFHKWLYLQAEAQINSPQYTKTLLAGQGIKAANNSGQAAVQSVFIKKLFYFNIPISIHFSPIKNLFLGAGLQYSMLTNGVALFQDTRLIGGFVSNVVSLQDSTLIVSRLGNFKHDSSYRQLRTNEWRFLLDLNYQWKRVTIGVRYNQAFSDFINIQVSPVNITQAQNRSLQLYLRFTVLDRRKKWLIRKK